MSRRAELPPTLAAAFSVAEAATAGVTRGRLAASDLVAQFRGARMARQSSDVSGASAASAASNEYELRHLQLLDRCRAYLPVTPAGFRFSHLTAALLYRMPLPPHLESGTDLHVGVPASAQPPRMRGVIGHRLDSQLDSRPDSQPGRTPTSAVLHGLPLVPSEVAWLQIAAILTLDDLIVAGDHLLRRKRPASTLARLREVVAGLRGQRGAVLARAATLDIRSGTDSPMETRMRLALIRAGLPEPVVGHTVKDADGFFVGTPDLCYTVEKVALEYEGDVHRTSRQTFRDDIERREQFEEIGWRVIRVTADHLRRPHGFVTRVATPRSRLATQVGCNEWHTFSEPKRSTSNTRPASSSTG